MKILRFTLLVSLLFALYAQAQEDEVVFQERFTNTNGEDVGFADLGWSAMILDPRYIDAEKPADVSTREGHPHASLSGISVNPGYEICFCDDDLGLVFIWSGSKSTWYAITKEDLNLDRSEMEITRVSFLHNTSADFNHEIRFMVKIGGQWYATAASYGRDGNDVGEWLTTEHTFTTDGADWLPITAEVDVALELGSPLSGSLPDGNIKGVGFYVYHPPSDGSIRIDELEVYAKAAEGGNGGGETPQWAGYDIVEQDGKQLIDTANWMGWVDVTAAPWVFPFSLNAYVYLEEAAAAGDTGAWVYMPK